MQVFNAKVRLQGNLLNEVAKRGLTVPEIYILRRIHGNDAVVDIKHVGEAYIDNVDERERLQYEYGDGLAALSDDQRTSVEKMFGAEYTALPEKLKDYQGDISDREADIDEYRQPEPHKDEEIGSNRSTAKKATSGKAAKPVPTGKGKASLEAQL